MKKFLLIALAVLVLALALPYGAARWREYRDA